MKDFDKLLNTLKDSILTYDYFVDFKKVFKNVDEINYNLNILNHLLGHPNFDEAFQMMYTKNPDVISVIPILLATRDKKFEITENKKVFYDFENLTNPVDYLTFIRKTGLIEIFYDHRIKNLVDYVTGVEVGLDSNSRKNRSGVAMNNIVYGFLKSVPEIEILKEANPTKVFNQWGITLNIRNKVFDFVVKDSSNHIFLIETNYYKASGSKLNETAKSYILLNEEINKSNKAKFMWITDGKGWLSVKNDLKSAYNSIEYLYNISDLENGILKNIFNKK